VRALATTVILVAACHGAAATSDAPQGDATVADAAAQVCMAGGIPGTCLDISVCHGSRQSAGSLACTGANMQCCTPSFAAGVTCDPNATPTPNDGLVEEAGDAGCPAGMAKVTTYCIDRFEASLVTDTGTWSPYFFPGGQSVKAASLRAAVPQAFISQLEAKAACAAAGKRMCSDVEWLRACQGSANQTYPYGNTRMPGVCNDARAVQPEVELYGTTAPWIADHLDSPCLDQEADGLARTGAGAGCVTAEGVFDMMGNVHEWTDNPTGTLRGGDYVDTVSDGNGCLYATTAHDPTYWDYSTGFRCCADAQ